MSGQQIGSFVGGVIGAYFGGPFGYAIGSAIGGAIGGYVDPTIIKGPKLTDATVQTANDGIPIPWILGTAPTAGNIIWTSELRERKKEDDGKGSGIVNVTYHYYRSYAIGICQGVRQADGTYEPIEGLLQVKRNGKIVYDVQPGVSTKQRAQNAKFLRFAKFYKGSETQLPDATIEAGLGVGNAPAYPGLVYMVVSNEELTQEAGAIPQYEFVVSVCGDTMTPAPPPLELLEQNLDLEATCVAFSTDSKFLAVGGYYDASSLSYMRIYDVDNGAFTDLNVTVPLSDRPQGFYWGAANELLVADQFTGSFMLKPGSGSFTVAATFPKPGHLSTYQERGIAFSPMGEEIWIAYGGPVHGKIARWRSNDFTYIAGGDLDLPANVEPFQCLDGGPDRTQIGNAYTVAVSLSDDPGVVFIGRQGDDIAVNSSLGIDARVKQARLNAVREIAAATPDAAPYWVLRSDIGVFDVAPAETSAAFVSWSPECLFVCVGARIFQRQEDEFVLFQTLANGSHLGPSSFSNDGKYLAVSSAGHRLSIYEGFGYGLTSEAIPDAPGYYIGNAGQIIGPPGPELTRCKPSLAEIARDVCLRAGLTDDDIDVADLIDDEVDGFKIAIETTGEASLAPLMAGFFFDAAEYDQRIRFVKRGGPVVAELTADDLCESDGDVIEETELQEAERLRKVHVRTIDPEAGFIATTQTAERRTSTVLAKGEQTTEIAVVTDKDTQAQMAEKKLKVAWAETRRFKTGIPYTRPELTVTDVIGLTDGKGRRQRVRLMEMTEDTGRIQIDEAMLDREAAYSSNAQGVQKLPPSVTLPNLIGPTFGVAMNLPSLRTQDNVPGAYLAACGYLSGWGGATILLSADGGLSYQEVARFLEPSTMGVLKGDLMTDAGPILVFLNAGSVSSLTAEQLLLRQNAFAITTNGVSEVGQFRTAAQDVDGIYTLSNLIRGALATPTVDHFVDDPFVMVASAKFVPLDIALAGRTLFFKFVSFGTSPDDATPVPFVFAPIFTSVTVDQYTDDAGNVYTDDAENVYYYEVAA